MILSMNLRTNFLIALSLLGKFDRMHAGAILGGWRTKSNSEIRPHNTVPGLHSASASQSPVQEGRSYMYVPPSPISESGHRVAALRLGEISVCGGRGEAEPVGPDGPLVGRAGRTWPNVPDVAP